MAGAGTLNGSRYLADYLLSPSVFTELCEQLCQL